MSENVPLDMSSSRDSDCAVWSESSVGAFWIVKDAEFPHVDNKDWSDLVDAQADLSLRWLHISEGTFSQVPAQLILGS